MPKHGTITGYYSQRCRCEDCRRAMREYQRSRYQPSTKRHRLGEKSPEIRTRKGVLYKRVGTRWRRAAIVDCAYCGKTIYVYLDKRRGANGYFCSHTCVNRGARWKGREAQKAAIHCVLCGRIRLVRKSQRHRYKTCGRKACHSTIMRRQGLRRHRASRLAATTLQ